MTRYLVDTCIWRDFYEDRKSKFGNTIGMHACRFFKKVIEQKDTILYSEGLILELNKEYDDAEIEDMLNLLIMCKILVRINITEKETLEAEKISNERNIPFIDCLNAIHARNYDAKLITRDKHFFNCLNDITTAYIPEKII